MCKYYNEEIKEEFLNSINTESTKKSYEFLFKKIKKYEDKFKKDVNNFSQEEYVELLKIFSTSKSNLGTTKRKLDQYINFCIPKYISTNALKLVNINELSADLNDLFLFTNTEYEMYKRKIIQHVNGEYYLSLFMCPYNGIMGNKFENIYNLRLSDIDENGFVKLHDGAELQINFELQMALNKTAKITSQTVGKSVNAEIPLSLYKYYDQVFKFFDTNNSFENYEARCRYNISQFFSKKLKSITGEKRISANSIYKSGLINYMYNQAKLNGYDLKSDIQSGDHHIFYKKKLLDFGTNMSWINFKFAFMNFILANY